MSSERVDPLANYQCQTQYSHQQSSITAKLFGFPLRAFRQCHYFLSTFDGGSQSNTELQRDGFLWPGSPRRLSWTWCRSYVVGCGDLWIFKSGSPRVVPVDGTMVGEKGKQLILELLTNSQNALPSTLAWDGAKWVVQPVLVKLSLIEILQSVWSEKGVVYIEWKRSKNRIVWEVEFVFLLTSWGHSRDPWVYSAVDYLGWRNGEKRAIQPVLLVVKYSLCLIY